MRGRRIWLVAAVVAAALLGTAAWLANVNQPGTRFVEYQMEHPLDMPTAIAAAPDGSIWFTIDLAAAMGRVRDGHLERLPLPSNNVEPSGLGVGPDGSAWYTDNSARAISRITPVGEISNFPLGTPIVRVGGLAVSSEGAVWFAEATGYSITRLKNGEITRHVFESPRGEPYGMAIASDGSAWATLKSADQLLHIGADDEMHVINVPRQAAVPTDIAVDGDGGIWFIESRDNRIARL